MSRDGVGVVCFQGISSRRFLEVLSSAWCLEWNIWHDLVVASVVKPPSWHRRGGIIVEEVSCRGGIIVKVSSAWNIRLGVFGVALSWHLCRGNIVVALSS